jgi:hypothetical protein
MRNGTLLPPVRPLPAATAGLRSEVRDFLAAERAAGRFVPACDAWLSAVAADRRGRPAGPRLTVTYVREREQFGRPLARFPTVQQELARMAGEVALIAAATQAAVAAEQAAVAAAPARDTISAVLAAKAQASHGAGIVAAIAHQLHGAIGTTEEHRLRLTTTRLWSWRDEDGSEAECFAELGRAALGAATRPGGLWPWLSESPGAEPAGPIVVDAALMQ